MEKIEQYLKLIFKTSLNAQRHFVNKTQFEIDRLVFCGLEKVTKISSSFLKLYPLLDDSIEFSLGILSRSILMDMILLMHVKKICTEYDGNNFEIVKEKIKEYCLKVLNDGTKYFLDEIDSSENLSAIQKKEYSAKFISKFSKAFNQGNGKPLLKKGYYLKTSEIYNISKDSHVSNEAIYNLYNYYSKYDHLSHWTSISGKIDFKDRKGKLD